MTSSHPQSRGAILWRTFFDQLFISESVTSDAHLRQAMIGVFALLPPGLVLLVELVHLYTLIARLYPQLIEAFLVRLGFVFVTYSMVSVGFVAVFVWDALTFDRRDAMVLGPLPVRATTIVLAKLGALAALLLGSSTAINLFTAVPFAFITADRMGLSAVVRHFAPHLVATTSAATFVFASLVAIKGLAAMTAGDRFAARVGALLQFACVTAVLCFALAIPHVLKSQSFTGSLAAAPWFPSGWFLGMFEILRGSSQPEISLLAKRGVMALLVGTIGAVGVSMLTVRHQLRAALAPSAFPSPIGSATLSRLAARLLVGGSREARAIADFILITIARNRAQQARTMISASSITTGPSIATVISWPSLSRSLSWIFTASMRLSAITYRSYLGADSGLAPELDLHPPSRLSGPSSSHEALKQDWWDPAAFRLCRLVDSIDSRFPAHRRERPYHRRPCLQAGHSGHSCVGLLSLQNEFSAA